MATGNPANSLLKAPARQPGLCFVALFLIAALLSTTLITPLYPPAQRLTMTITTALGTMLGLSMAKSGDILTVNGFAMQIIGQCTALNYVVILALAILLYTRHSLLYRIKGVIATAIIVLLVNAIRLVVTGLAGSLSLRVFHMVHEYLWVAIFALLIFALWKVWADQKLDFTKETIQQISIAVSGSAIISLFLMMVKNLHCQLLATLATPLFKVLLGDSQATLVWNGVQLVCRHGNTTSGIGIFFEIANLAVYTGLMLPYVWRNRKALPLALAGLVALVVMYAEFIALMGVNCINRGYEQAQVFQLVGSGTFLALPMALYWLVTAGIARKKHA